MRRAKDMSESDIGDKDKETTDTASGVQTKIDIEGRVETDTETALPDMIADLEEHVVNESTQTTGATKDKTKIGQTPLSNLTRIVGDRVSEDVTGVKNNYNEAEETPPCSSESDEYRPNESFKEAEKQFVYFWKKQDVFSQWHPSPFEVDNKEFCCAEQYMMYMKAVLLHDDQLAKRILKCKDPRRIKSLGRQTEQFSEDLWVHNCLHVVKEGNLAKFRQNETLKNKLFGTYPCILVEASPYDKVWGIGLDKFEPCAWNEATWEGKNLLGYILTEVRDELMCECGIITESDKKVYFEKLTDDLKKTCFGRKNTHDRTPGYYREELPPGYYSNESSSHLSPETASKRQEHTEEKTGVVDIVNEKNTIQTHAEETTAERDLAARKLYQAEIDGATMELEGTAMERTDETS